jgi:hypothetical protein
MDARVHAVGRLAAGDLTNFACTRPNVTGIQAVTNYTSVKQLNEELGLKPAEEGPRQMDGGAAVAILGHEFLVPNDPRWSHEDLLRQPLNSRQNPPSSASGPVSGAGSVSF